MAYELVTAPDERTRCPGHALDDCAALVLRDAPGATVERCTCSGDVAPSRTMTQTAVVLSATVTVF